MNWTVLATLLSGVLVGFIPNYLVQRRQERHGLRTRWDTSLYTLSVEFISATQRFRHAVDQPQGSSGVDERTKLISRERQTMSSLLVQLRLVGSVRVQRAARMVIRHAWAVMRVNDGHEDERAAEFNNAPPATRLSDALQEFIRATRIQLRVEDAEEIAAYEPSDWSEPASESSVALRLFPHWR